MIDLQTLKEAARGAGERIDGVQRDEIPVDDPTRSELRKKIHEMLTAESGTEDTMGVADRVVERLIKMVWPQKAIEIKKKRFEIEVEQRAMAQFLKEEIKEIMRGMDG